ncbi:MAG: hypothetical protein HZB41_00225 [Ignavibacteriae bacterium]|nr:hypothetical protein [Ignavibacteriota bacterium]
MNKIVKMTLLWTPRLLCILFALFISMFSLDVFSEARSFFSTLTALLLHLIPTFIIIGVLILSWRWEWVGAIAYVGMSVLYGLMINFKRWDWIALISTPLLLIGLLFLISWFFHDQLREKTEK